ncbi:10812_t:CDS:1 [Acaulospora morrowiae]|uniref:10812_t:CDS:1 n=1 Tax=Acaulospora morrowiae TaxID=94023 RepID=A0A9N9BRG4_9GLOM|nr:10812_t:CDS:1 [Acaulospora morrowiae]
MAKSVEDFKDFPPIQKAIKLSTSLVCDLGAQEVQERLNQLKHSIHIQLNGSQHGEKAHHWPTLWAHIKMCMIDLKYWERGNGHPADRLSESYIRMEFLRLYFEIGNLSRKKQLEGIVKDLLEIQLIVEQTKNRL